MNTNDDEFEALEGPFEQTPGTSATDWATGSDGSDSLVELVPDDNMVGVVGDLVQSINGEDGEKHFVSPKKSTENPGDYVILKATGVSEETFPSIFEWGEGGEAVPDKPLKRRVKRDSTGKTEVTIKVKEGGLIIRKMNVWVIWATGTPHRVTAPVFTQFAATPAQQNPPKPAVPAGSKYGAPNSGFTWRFVFTIAPLEIITAEERPNLEGAQDKSHDVPGATKPYPTEPNNPNRHADEAVKKWDTSRQMKWAITDSTGTTNPVTFPTDDVEGNDDALGQGVDEENNPYQAYSGSSSLTHDVGEIASADGPEFGRYITQGSTDGEIYRKDVDFREFARVQLWDGKRTQGKFWFRISDFSKWHHYFRAKFNKPFFIGSPTWDNDGSNDGQP